MYVYIYIYIYIYIASGNTLSACLRSHPLCRTHHHYNLHVARLVRILQLIVSIFQHPDTRLCLLAGSCLTIAPVETLTAANSPSLCSETDALVLFNFLVLLHLFCCFSLFLWFPSPECLSNMLLRSTWSAISDIKRYQLTSLHALCFALHAFPFETCIKKYI